MKYIICILILVIVIVKLHNTTPNVTYADNWRYIFAVELLHKAGNNNPTQFMIQEVINWTLAEDNYDNANDRNNPLNTTLCSGDPLGKCEDAIQATIDTLTNGLYNDVIIAMQNNDVNSFKYAVWNSPWDSNHYEYGRNWPK